MNLIAQLEAEQIASLGKTIPDFKAGDTVRVGYKVTEGTRTRVQNYEGVVISRKGGETLGASFTVRKISFGEGVERVFPLYSTNIDKIEVIRRGRVRRAKLYYLRGRTGKSARIAERRDTREAVVRRLRSRRDSLRAWPGSTCPASAKRCTATDGRGGETSRIARSHSASLCRRRR